MEIIRSFQEQDFFEMELLERQFYSSEFITPAEESCSYAQQFPLSTVAVADGGHIIGFINLFPVRETVFQGLLHGTYNDSTLTVSDIAPISTAEQTPLHMFLSCIAVDPAYRKQGAATALLTVAVSGYADVQQRCDLVVTDNVTAEGRRFSERLGFGRVCKSDHGSTVYAMPYADFAAAVSARREG